ncbi:thioredoxin domain-containing protein 15 [Neocloeon triangulifer]|uniref:thioredoxin domain-containing protein 15 n=1 Tax=Neocloeon triangulifer TaxID=2078957 RepID=UPI00286F220D|nr:thioredoxin domain-containing protein 15 [Neocloeon triangulifer]
MRFVGLFPAIGCALLAIIYSLCPCQAESSASLEQIDHSTNLLPTGENEEVLVEEGEIATEENPVGEPIVDPTIEEKNVTAANATSTFSVACKPYADGPTPVELVNGTGLLALLETEANVTSRKTPGRCVGLLFYASWCPFSCLAAPFFNALPRTFPAVKFAAIDSMKHYSWNTQFGIVGVPTFLLFHNGRPVARFNETDYNLKMFAKFVKKWTGIEPEGMLNVYSADFAGPLPNVVEQSTDQWLILSWAFVAFCGIFAALRSTLWRHMIDGVKRVWREADEVHHEHAD